MPSAIAVQGAPEGRQRPKRTRLLQALAAALLATAAALGAVGSAGAAEVTEAEFRVSISDGEGNARSVQADVVPYVPGRACFGWRLRLAGSPGLVRYREVLKLPEAPTFWSGEDDAYSPHQYSADRTIAITEAFAAPDQEGWIESAWCIAEGDPTGPHSIDVFIDDRLVRHFEFEVRRLDD